MGGNVGSGGAQFGDRAFHVGHAGVVQQDHVGQTALVAVAIIRRRDHVGGDRGIRAERLHVRVGPWNREGALPLRIGIIGCERTKRHRTAQTGQENGKVRVSMNPVYYSLTGRPATRKPAAASHFGGVCAASITNGPVIPGHASSREPGISRFRVRCFASPRNDSQRQFSPSHQRFLNANCRY